MNKPRKSCRFIPASIIFPLAQKVGINFKDIERNILAYITYNGYLEIRNPKLPIKITPEFDSIVAHLMGDGTDRRSRDVLTYTKCDQIAKERFYQKVQNVFGTLYSPLLTKRKKDIIRDYKEIVLPSIVHYIIQIVYKKVKFSSYEARLPPEIKNKSKYFKLAVLTAFLVDEGTIHDSITLRLANKRLLRDLWEIANSLGYNCSKITKLRYENGYIYTFYIRLESAHKLLRDIDELTSIYPTCDLAHKQTLLTDIVKRQDYREIKPYERYVNRKILNLLENSPKTCYEISTKLLLNRRSTLRHLKRLEKENKIKKIGTKGRAILWISTKQKKE